MELVVYLTLIVLISVGSFWVAANVYGLCRTPKIYFPLPLAAMMAITAVLGGFALMIGGVIISTLVFNSEMKKRPDYKPWSTMLAGAVISISCSVLIYYSIFYLAWAILD